MILKEGTTFADLDSAIIFAAIVIDGVYQEYGVTTGVTLTSGTDGHHSQTSLHYPNNSPSGKGRAIDCRIWNLPGGKAKAPEVGRKIRERLTKAYDVVVETTHIHVEYDPK